MFNERFVTESLKKMILHDQYMLFLSATVNAFYNFASCGRAGVRACGRAHDRILAWTNLDLSVECFKRAGVRACRRAGVRAWIFPSVAIHVNMF